MAITYKAAVQLVNSFRQSGWKPRISDELMKTVKTLGIQKKQRGKRGGAQNNRSVRDKTDSVRTRVATPQYKAIKIGYLNARSVCNKTSAITDLIAEKKLDVLAITETWLTGGPADEVVCGEITPPQYDLQHVTRVKRGGGVAALVNKALKGKKMKNYKTTNI